MAMPDTLQPAADIEPQDHVTARRRPYALYARRALRHVILVAALLFFLFPIYFMVTASTKNRLELFAQPPTLLPQAPNLDGYRDLFVNRQFGLALRNSLIVVSISVVLSILLG